MTPRPSLMCNNLLSDMCTKGLFKMNYPLINVVYMHAGTHTQKHFLDLSSGKLGTQMPSEPAASTPCGSRSTLFIR